MGTQSWLRRVLNAREAIREVMSDTSVPARQTFENLKDLREEIDIMLDSLKETIKREGV